MGQTMNEDQSALRSHTVQGSVPAMMSDTYIQIVKCVLKVIASKNMQSP